MEIFITILIVAFASYSLYKSFKKSAKGGCSGCSGDKCPSKGNCSSITKENSDSIKFAK